MTEYIDKQVIEDIRIPPAHYIRSDYNTAYQQGCEDMLALVKSITPAANVRENKRGHWIEVEGGKNQCSECGHITNERIAVYIPADDDYVSKGGVLLYRVWKHPYFCSKCGADVRGGQDG